MNRFGKVRTRALKAATSIATGGHWSNQMMHESLANQVIPSVENTGRQFVPNLISPVWVELKTLHIPDHLVDLTDKPDRIGHAVRELDPRAGNMGFNSGPLGLHGELQPKNR